MSNPSSLTALEHLIGIRFKNKDILHQSMTHRSSIHDRSKHGHNERLEFLGDAVLQLITTEYLYQLTDREEGELTSWRSALVQGNHLCEIARELKIGQYLYLSRGEEASGGRDKDSTLANAVEALIGAIYLDQGLEIAKQFIMTFILTHLKYLLARGRHKDEKSKLQEVAQEKTGLTPSYKTLDEKGPDHKKLFTCAVYLGEEQVAEGQGSTKQKAEQDAARLALKIKGWK